MSDPSKPRDSRRPGRSESELAVSAGEGSAADFEELVVRLGPRLLGYLRQRMGEAHAAEDVLQETFVKAHRSLATYDPARSLITWLLTIATREAISYGRRRTALPAAGLDPSAAGPGPLEILIDAEARRDLWALAGRILSPDASAAMWLRYGQEMSVGEIALVLGKSVGAVKVLLHRARLRLVEARRPGGASDTPTSNEVQCELR